jgi:hypothetical protein
LLLLDIVIAKRSLYVKARDYVLLFGYDSDAHYKMTLLGRLLSRLAELGLAKRHNGSKPLRYTLQPKWRWMEFVKRCGNSRQRFRCESEATACGIIGLCPYWVLKQTHLEKKGGSSDVDG